MMKALRSVEEAAELLGISKWTVRAYIREGKLRPVRLGRRVLVAEEELERFVALCQNPVRTQATTEAASAKAGEASL
jgi:excisionase family DNA binding protein